MLKHSSCKIILIYKFSFIISLYLILYTCVKHPTAQRLRSRLAGWWLVLICYDRTVLLLTCVRKKKHWTMPKVYKGTEHPLNMWFALNIFRHQPMQRQEPRLLGFSAAPNPLSLGLIENPLVLFPLLPRRFSPPSYPGTTHIVFSDPRPAFPKAR
jgi:hypothetical protein